MSWSRHVRSDSARGLVLRSLLWVACFHFLCLRQLLLALLKVGLPVWAAAVCG